MSIDGQKNFSCNIDPKVAEAFSAQVDERGYTKYRAIEGALKAFISLPDQVQVALMKANNPDFHKVIYQNLRDIELTKVLKALTNEQRMVLIETSKKVTKRLFPKKKARK